MIVGILQLDLRIPAAHSLKDKRRVLLRLKDRARQKFNIAIAEVEYQDVHQQARLGVTTVSNDGRHVQSTLDHVVNFVTSQPDVQLIDHQIETL